MAKVIRRHWVSDQGSGLPRRDRLSCDYEAYLPDSLVGRAVVLEGPVAADISEAEAALTRFSLEVGALADGEALARLLLRAEAVASSRIEGLEVGGRRLLMAPGEDRGDPGDVSATEVLNNIEAMRWAVETAADEPFPSTICSRSTAGCWWGPGLRSMAAARAEQNWIGGSYNPCSASLSRRRPSTWSGLLDDLCAFCNDDALPAVAQAAIAHAQFETIHPFVDGNGRTGRALIQVVLKRRASSACRAAGLAGAGDVVEDYVAG